MKYGKKIPALAVLAIGAVMPFASFSEITPVTSSSYTGFSLNTEKTPLVVSGKSELSKFVVAPFTYRKGESITYVAPDGTEGTLVESAQADGTCTFTPDKAGVWKFVNSRSGSVLLGVAWDALGVKWSATSPLSALFAMQTDTSGPDRKTGKEVLPKVAYSGDNWRGDVTKPAKLTFTPPAGSGLEATTLELQGTGVSRFDFNCLGLWGVSLEMVDGTVHTAEVFIRGGFTVYVR